MKPIRISAFSQGNAGGNPAGVVVGAALPSAEEMQKMASELGYSETAFAAPEGDSWRVRYYAPVGEVAFCGHATIALGAVLGAQEGEGTFRLNLRDDSIGVAARQENGNWHAALQSPRTWSEPMADDLLAALLDGFALSEDDLDPQLPPLLAFGGVRHGILALKARERLRAMSYPFEVMRDVMAQHDLITVSLLYLHGPRSFVARNAFASGGVVEDPATGAAAAALGGALVDLDWDGLGQGGRFSILQGEDMGMPSAITVDVSGQRGDSVRVSGAARWI